MANEYYLRDYALTQEPNDFIAIVVSKGTASLEDLVQMMVQRDSSLTSEDIQVVFEKMRCAAKALLDQGFRVTGPLAVVDPNIQGVFYGEGDAYNPQCPQSAARRHAQPSVREGVAGHSGV